MRFSQVGLSVALCGLFFPLGAQEWAKYFRDSIDPDRKVRDAAAVFSIDVLIPRVMGEDLAAARLEVPEIAMGLTSSDPRIRVSASAILATIAILRHSDGSEVLRDVTNDLIKLLQDDNANVRANGVRALALARPDIRIEAFGPLLQAARAETPYVSPVATEGIVRLAKVSPEAARALELLVADSKSPDNRIAAVVAIRNYRLQGEIAVRILRRALDDREFEVVENAIVAIGSLGGEVKAALKSELEALSARTTDPRVRDAVRSLFAPREKDNWPTSAAMQMVRRSGEFRGLGVHDAAVESDDDVPCSLRCYGAGQPSSVGA
jgi:HEAT repeat protein